MLATPFYFGPDRLLFGWYHAARSSLAQAGSVVLCPPLGYESVCSYACYLRLAERLAEAGLSVLRFEYFATGNSAGDFQAPNLVQTWLSDIGHAIDELKQQSGAATVTLMGQRAGALLACCAAAERDDIASLVLWEPCTDGRSFVRQLKLLEASSAPDEPSPPSGCVQAAGFIFTQATLAALAMLDVRKIARLPRVPVLSLSSLRSPALGDTLRRHGMLLTEAPFDSYPELVRAPIYAQLPRAELDLTLAWCTRSGPAARRDAPARSASLVAPLPAQRSLRSPSGGPTIHERAVRMPGNLFGVLVSSDLSDRSKPAVVFLNTGADPHHGPHRLYVTLARAWAEEGYTLLRFDLAGIGASPGRTETSANEAYPSGALEDVTTAVHYLSTLGHAAVILVGLCSGAYHAIHAAHRGVPVHGIIAVNAPLFFLPGRPPLMDPDLNALALARVRQALCDPKVWRRLLTGNLNLPYNVAVLASGLRLWMEGLRQVRRRVSRSPSSSRVATRQVTSLFSAAKVRTCLIFSRDDAGHAYFLRAVGTALRELQARPGFTISVVDHADHTFSSLRLQRSLMLELRRALELQTNPVASAQDPRDTQVKYSPA
ncbi:MAG: hypothetical protein JWN48_1364 [Myxococcaceae bacterium]|nr:hypothetical protein [Myxococcaceae bacterium]